VEVRELPVLFPLNPEMKHLPVLESLPLLREQQQHLVHRVISSLNPETVSSPVLRYSVPELQVPVQRARLLFLQGLPLLETLALSFFNRVTPRPRVRLEP
jgi:hypothetical protein